MATVGGAIETSWQPSPNHGERRGGVGVDMLVLHYTGMASAAAALAWLCDRRSEVSSHYFIDGDGAVVQCVAEDRRAWHAGRSCWHGERDLNSRSIGIEIDNPGHEGGYPDFAPAQIAAATALCKDICSRHRIPAQRVLAHSDIAPGRKIDPGEKFPWARLAAEGIGHWVEPAAIEDGPELGRGDSGEAVARLQATLARYGYPIVPSGAYQEETEVVVAAFQRHFRPARVDGVADRSTIDTLERLMAALPG